MASISEACHALLLAWLSVCLAVIAGRAAAAPSAVLQKPVVMLIGDSITELGTKPGGWAASMADLYQRKADVINRGFGGYNSRWALYVLDEMLGLAFPKYGPNAAQRIQLATVWYGTNDAVVPERRDGYLTVPVTEYRANLEAIVGKLKKGGVPNIIMLSPVPTIEDRRAVYANETATGSDRINARTAVYAAAAKAAAANAGVAYIDLFGDWTANNMTLAQIAAGPDGLHLSPDGNQLVFDAILEVINSDDNFSDVRSIDQKAPNNTFGPFWKTGSM